MTRSFINTHQRQATLDAWEEGATSRALRNNMVAEASARLCDGNAVARCERTGFRLSFDAVLVSTESLQAL